MSDRMRESISALLDDEADELELRRLLASENPQDLRGIWRDYHLQRDALQGGDLRFAHLDISARVQAALADEAMPALTANTRWWRPLASVAVAASVATVVVIGARSFSTGSDSAAAVAQVQAPASFTAGRVYPGQANPNIGNVAVGAQLTEPLFSTGQFSKEQFSTGQTYPSAQTVSADADQLAQQRLQQYLLRHTERASLNNGQGVISFAKVSQLKAE